MRYNHFVDESAGPHDPSEIEEMISLVDSTLQEIRDIIAQRKPIHIRNVILWTIFAVLGIVGAYHTSNNGKNTNRLLFIASGMVAGISALWWTYHGIRSIRPQTFHDRADIDMLLNEKIVLLRIAAALKEGESVSS